MTLGEALGMGCSVGYAACIAKSCKWVVCHRELKSHMPQAEITGNFKLVVVHTFVSSSTASPLIYNYPCEENFVGMFLVKTSAGLVVVSRVIGCLVLRYCSSITTGS